MVVVCCSIIYNIAGAPVPKGEQYLIKYQTERSQKAIAVYDIPPVRNTTHYYTHNPNWLLWCWVHLIVAAGYT